jgi:hypothetical protein
MHETSLFERGQLIPNRRIVVAFADVVDQAFIDVWGLSPYVVLWQAVGHLTEMRLQRGASLSHSNFVHKVHKSAGDILLAHALAKHRHLIPVGVAPVKVSEPRVYGSTNVGLCFAVETKHNVSICAIFLKLPHRLGQRRGYACWRGR